jgi:hypothetical protein
MEIDLFLGLTAMVRNAWLLRLCTFARKRKHLLERL